MSQRGNDRGDFWRLPPSGTNDVSSVREGLLSADLTARRIRKRGI